MNKKELLIEITVLVFIILIGYQILKSTTNDWFDYCNKKFGINNWTAIQVFGHEECGIPWYSLINDCFKCVAIE